MGCPRLCNVCPLCSRAAPPAPAQVPLEFQARPPLPGAASGRPASCALGPRSAACSPPSHPCGGSGHTPCPCPDAFPSFTCYGQSNSTPVSLQLALATGVRRYLPSQISPFQARDGPKPSDFILGKSQGLTVSYRAPHSSPSRLESRAAPPCAPLWVAGSLWNAPHVAASRPALVFALPLASALVRSSPLRPPCWRPPGASPAGAMLLCPLQDSLLPGSATLHA